jgi:hypothetical protein
MLERAFDNFPHEERHVGGRPLFPRIYTSGESMQMLIDPFHPIDVSLGYWWLYPKKRSNVDCKTVRYDAQEIASSIQLRSLEFREYVLYIERRWCDDSAVGVQRF